MGRRKEGYLNNLQKKAVVLNTSCSEKGLAENEAEKEEKTRRTKRRNKKETKKRRKFRTSQIMFMSSGR
jgi:hypothetical protein